MEGTNKQGPESMALKGKGAKISMSLNKGSAVSFQEGEHGSSATSSIMESTVTLDSSINTTNRLDSSDTPSFSVQHAADTLMEDKARVFKTKKMSDYKKAKKMVINARHILKLAEELKNTDNPVNPTKIEWANKTLSELDDDKVSKLKRVRSTEEDNSSKRIKTQHASPSSSRRVKVLDDMLYNDIIKMDLRVVIVDLNDCEWRINKNNFAKVENRIIKEIYKFITKNPDKTAPVFRMDEKFRGFYVISCDSSSSVEFLRTIVGQMGSLWEGAKLDVKLLREIPTLPKLFIAVPMEPDDEKDKDTFGKMVLAVLKSQNPQLAVDKWKVLTVGNLLKDCDRALVTIRIDVESGIQFDVMDPMVNFGCRRVRVKVTRNQLTQFNDDIERKMVEQLATSLAAGAGDDIPTCNEDATSIFFQNQ